MEALVSLPSTISKRELTLQSYISLPQGVKATPPQLNVHLKAEGDPKEITVKREVKVHPSNNQYQNLKITPSTVNITLQIPFYWDEKRQTLNQVSAEVQLPDSGLSQKPVKLPVELNLPQSVKALSIDPAKVTVEAD